MSARSLILAVVLAALVSGATAGVARANALDRDREPVVLTGADVPSLIGTTPGRVVAFRYDGEWVLIPVQIDEMATVDFGTIYGLDPTGLTVLTYADTSTFTGPDPDPTFDGDDELVFMSADAGGEQSTAAEPAGARHLAPRREALARGPLDTRLWARRFE